MKVVALNGSCRKDGNISIIIDIVLNELIKQGIETEVIQLADDIIEPCQACFSCHDKKCTLNKDSFHEIFEKIIHADRRVEQSMQLIY